MIAKASGIRCGVRRVSPFLAIDLLLNAPTTSAFPQAANEEMKMRASLVIAIGSALSVGVALPSLAAGAPNQRAVAINFGLTEDGKPVGCAAPLSNLGSSKVDAKLREARLYVYGVKLIDKKGGRTPISLEQNNWQYADLAHIDFRDARGGSAPCSPTNPPKNTAITGSAPAGDYVGLEFSVGVPVESQVDGKTVALNHSSVETAPPPLDVQAMSWNWQAGRRFFRSRSIRRTSSPCPRAPRREPGWFISAPAAARAIRRRARSFPARSKIASRSRSITSTPRRSKSISI